MKLNSILILVAMGILAGHLEGQLTITERQCFNCCLDKEIETVTQTLVNKVAALENQLGAGLKNVEMLLAKVLDKSSSEKKPVEVTLVAKCPVDYKEFKDSCYYFGKKAATWSNAKQLCAGKGAALIAVETSEEDQFIRNTLSSLPGAFQFYYTGGKKQNNKWLWDSTGLQIASYQNWSRGQGNTANQDCLVYWIGNKFAEWHEHYCNTRNIMSYICEKQK